MTRLQTALIWINSLYKKLGLLDNPLGVFLYLKIYLFYKEKYEGKSLSRILDFLRSTFGQTFFSQFIDIGAHVGATSRMAKIRFPDVKIIAFEADPRNAKLFSILHKEDIDLGLTILEVKAIWRESGFVPFSFQKSNTANNKLDFSSNELVPCTSLDDYFQKEVSDNWLIKIDVQGFELEVLQSASKLLFSSNLCLIVEFDKSEAELRNSNFMETLALLKHASYYPWDIENNCQMKEEDLIKIVSDVRCLDVLFLKC